MYAFGPKSVKALTTCHPDLAAVMHKALSYGVMDFSILEGARTTKRQQELFAQQKSKIDGVARFSKHQVGKGVGRTLSDAVDIAPYPLDWKNKLAFHVLVGLVFAAAAELNIKVRWGGDWDGDFSAKDQSFHDLPHIERVR